MDKITDDMLIKDLTVGQFKELIWECITKHSFTSPNFIQPLPTPNPYTPVNPPYNPLYEVYCKDRLEDKDIK